MRLTYIIRHYLKLPLMWVMLLWALTLPGHELAVYSFLVKGSVYEIAPSLISTPGDEENSVRQQAVQVFLDANTTTPVVLNPQQAIKCFLQLFAFAPPADDLPVYKAASAGTEVLAQIFPITIQPNAP